MATTTLQHKAVKITLGSAGPSVRGLHTAKIDPSVLPRLPCRISILQTSLHGLAIGYPPTAALSSRVYEVRLIDDKYLPAFAWKH
jgi:hypothetical protein